MATKKSNRTEIEPWELKDMPVGAGAENPPIDIIRQNYREPISSDDLVRAEINGTVYPVNDMGSRGLGITVPSLDSFKTGSPCRILLHIGDNTLELNGTIAHTSPSEATGDCRCGIDITKVPANQQTLLQQFLLAHHERLFGEGLR